MSRLLLVSYRPLEAGGGAVARWRSLAPYLAQLDWQVDVVSAGPRAASAEYEGREDARAALRRRARLMAGARRGLGPVLSLAGLRPAAVTPSTAWAVRGAARVRDALRARPADVVLATAPPIAAAIAGRAGVTAGVPLAIELRDLWAGNPAYGAAYGPLGVAERWLLDRAAAIVVVTPEAAVDVRARHPRVASRVVEIPNGFEDDLLERRPPPAPPGRPLVILHSGTLLPARPLAPLLRALARREPGGFRLVLHGYNSPETGVEIAAAPPRVDVEVVPPSSWRDAVERIARADVCLVTQSAAAGDATAVAGKVYEYLALGRPVLCLTDGGATEALLRRLGADQLAVRLGDDAALDAVLDRLERGELPPAVPPVRLQAYRRSDQARRLADLLGAIAS